MIRTLFLLYVPHYSDSICIGDSWADRPADQSGPALGLGLLRHTLDGTGHLDVAPVAAQQLFDLLANLRGPETMLVEKRGLLLRRSKFQFFGSSNDLEATTATHCEVKQWVNNNFFFSFSV